ncbi:MAG: hypothetical protein IT305_25730 [Chloroflexi bacterium]|nr:hypothetical protein [Chloroflexota bacterium]
MERQRGGNTWSIWRSFLLTAGYGALLYLTDAPSGESWLGEATGIPWFDAVLGVILGLYVCSHPAANAIDLLYLHRGPILHMSSRMGGLGWVALNVAAMAVGLLVIVVGTTRLVR